MANPIKGFNTKDGVAQYDYNALANRPEDGTGTIISPNADYAEVGEWEDGNPASEDRLGYFVAIAAVEDNTIKIRKATSQDDVKGVTVFNPAFSGNATAEKYVSAGVLYPQYSYVGLMGIVSVIDNGTCTVGGRCMPADDGTAVPSSNNMGYGVLKRINASHVLIAVEPGADMIQRIKEDIEGIENKLDDNIEANKKTAAAVSSLANQTEKRVSNLEAAVYGDLAQENEDNSLAYVKDVPSNVVVNPRSGKSYARIDAIGGMTRKWNQLLAHKSLGWSNTVNGVTLTVNNDGSITLNGQATSRASFGAITNNISVVGGHKYYIDCGDTTLHIGWDLSTSEGNGNEQITTAVNDLTAVVQLDIFSTTTVFNNKTFFPKIVDLTEIYGAGNEPTSVADLHINRGFEPYDAGSLRSSPVTEIESVGRNIFGGEAMANKIKEVNVNATINTEKKTVSYYAGGISDKVVFTDFKPNTQYTIIFKGRGSSGFLNLIVRYTDGTNGDFDKIPTTDAGVVRFVSAPSKSIKGLYGIGFDGSTTLFYDECGIFEGDVQAADFTPYVKHTLPIPEAVRALDGYGEGINVKYNNNIRYEEDGRETYIPMVKHLVLDGVTNGKKMDATDNQAGGKSSYYAYLLPETLPILSGAPVVWCGEVGVGTSTVLSVSVKNDILKLGDNPTPAEITNAINAHLNALYVSGKPVEVVYVPAKHTTEDISDILPADNLIGVEGGGTLTFKNEYGYDVPSEVTFVTKGASA